MKWRPLSRSQVRRRLTLDGKRGIRRTMAEFIQRPFISTYSYRARYISFSHCLTSKLGVERFRRQKKPPGPRHTIEDRRTWDGWLKASSVGTTLYLAVSRPILAHPRPRRRPLARSSEHEAMPLTYDKVHIGRNVTTLLPGNFLRFMARLRSIGTPDREN